MSHMAKVATKLRQKSALVKALKEMRPGWQAEVHAQPVAMRTYYARDMHSAEIIVRNVGMVSTDVGFAQQSDGTYALVADNMNRELFGPTFLNRLTQLYAKHIVIEQQARSGYRVLSEKVRTDGTIEMVVEQ